MQINTEAQPYDSINVTPMLDLAYVLLVVFILMTTASVQGLNISMPKPSNKPSTEQRDLRIVQVMPGGALLVCDTDWATASWGIGDAALAERVKQAWCATKEHFDAGRRIPEWLLAAGYEVVAWDPRVLANADATGDTFHGHTWKTYRRLLERLGTVSVEDLDRFDRLCAETTAAGTFTFTVTRHAWLARTPGGAT
jgi:biopolymer transport protein ExbD